MIRHPYFECESCRLCKSYDLKFIGTARHYGEKRTGDGVERVSKEVFKFKLAEKWLIFGSKRKFDTSCDRTFPEGIVRSFIGNRPFPS
jgi:hypothetical protein